MKKLVNWTKDNRAITLMEILLVVMILAIMASLAYPRFIKIAEKARSGEAISSLRLIYNGEKIYMWENEFYYAPGALSQQDAEDFLNIFIEEKHYDYRITSSDSSRFFTATAERRSSGETITINQNGTWSGTSLFVP